MDDNLKFRLLTAMIGLRRMDMVHPRQIGMNMIEFYLLHLLERLDARTDGGEVFVSDIRASLQMSLPAVSQQLGNLERRGVIERNIAKDDRRKVAVRLTEEGNRLLRESRREAEDGIGRIVAELGEKDTEELIRLLGRLRDVFRAYSKNRF